MEVFLILSHLILLFRIFLLWMTSRGAPKGLVQPCYLQVPWFGVSLIIKELFPLRYGSLPDLFLWLLDILFKHSDYKVSRCGQRRGNDKGLILEIAGKNIVRGGCSNEGFLYLLLYIHSHKQLRIGLISKLHLGTLTPLGLLSMSPDSSLFQS